MSNGTVDSKQPLSLQTGELRIFLQSLQSDILKDVDTEFFKAIGRLHMELELKRRKPNDVVAKSEHKSSERPEELPCKEFVVRNSKLTNLWENAHMRSLFNICPALLVFLYLNITVIYCLNFQKLKDDINVVLWTFGQFHIVTALWVGIHVSIVFLLYPAFRVWAKTRLFIKKKVLYDTMFGCWFAIYQLGLLLIPARIVVEYNLPPVSSFTIVAEQSRLFMKTYAFVRENAPRVLKYKPQQDDDQNAAESKPFPQIENLIYFLFAPTLVYRDNYPRTSHVRWSYVGWNFLQVFCCIIGAYIPCTHFIVDTFNKIGIEPIPLVNFMGTIVMSIFAGSILMFLTFYGMFHCWLNAFAEMMRFGDRKFYDDWWNCTSFAKYFRSWNMVVHDWIYSYIYRDMYTLLGRNRTGAMLVVFLISAVIHECILAICFKFVFPVLFILFSTFGIIFVFVTRRSTSNFWNAFLWGSMFQGWGLLTVFYSLEWYARINCPRTEDSWLDYVVPRSFSCDVISLP